MLKRIMMCMQHHEGNHDRTFEYLTKAAGLGHADAHFHLALLYRDGAGVEMDAKKELHHLEEAAIGGHPDARANLWNVEGRRGQYGKSQ